MLGSLSCGKAALILFGNTLAGKFYMTLVMRVGKVMLTVMPGPADLGFTATTEKAKKMEEINKAKAFEAVSKAQLNEAEYSGPLIAVCLFLEAKGVESPIGCGLVVFGAIAHLWAQILFKTRAAQPLGALPRYAGMACLLYSLYGVVM